MIFLWCTINDDVIEWKHFPRDLPFVRGIHRSAVISPHKGQWRRALTFSLICAWMHGWVNNREAGDLRRQRAHYDFIVMWFMSWGSIWALCTATSGNFYAPFDKYRDAKYHPSRVSSSCLLDCYAAPTNLAPLNKVPRLPISNVCRADWHQEMMTASECRRLCVDTKKCHFLANIRYQGFLS